jgi:hypothetical protein
MAMKTSYLIGLLAAGFIILFIGLPWWMGIGVIILAMAAAVTGTESQAMPSPQHAGPREPAWKKYQEKGPPGSVTDNFYFRPTTPPDGIATIGSISTPKEERVPGDLGNLSVGKRTGTMSLYMDPEDIPWTDKMRVRLKDDIRLHMPFMKEMDPMNKGMAFFQNLATAHFRTGKPIIKTKALEPTFETQKLGHDQWAKEWEDEAQEMYEKYGIPP